MVAFALGLGALSLLNLVPLALGFYRRGPLTVGLVLLAITGAAALAVELRHLRLTRPSPPSGPVAGVLILLLVALAFTFVGAVAPETGTDALSFHIGFPLQWLQTGRLTFERSWYTAGYPLEVEVLYGDAISLGGSLAPKMLNLGFALLLIGAIIDLGRRLFTLRAALVGALIFAVAPVVFWDSITANVDMANAAFLVLAVDVAVARFDRPDRRSAIACGLLFGFALASKLTSIEALPAVLILLVAVRHRGRRDRVVDCLVVAVLGALPVLPYLIRTEIITGDPVFPYLYGLFGAKQSLWNAGANAGLVYQQLAYGVGHGVLKLVTLPGDLLEHPVAFQGPIGVLLLIAPPLALRWRPRKIPTLVATGALIYVVLWFWPGKSLQARYLIPALAVLAPFAGAGLERAALAVSTVSRRLATLVVVAVASVVVLTLPPFINLQTRDGIRKGEILYRLPLSYFLGGESKQSYLAGSVPTYLAELQLARRASPTDRVLTITNFDIDQVDTPIQHVPFFAVDVGGIYVGPREALAALSAQHIRFVLFGRDGLRWKFIALNDPGFKRRYLRLVYQDANARLYVVRSADS
jgi:hypothetical protein